MSHTHHGEDYRDINGVCGVCGCTAITHGQARRIAAEWHGGETSALCALATSGYVDKDGLEREIDDELSRPWVETAEVGAAERELRALRSYVESREDGKWDAYQGAWSNLWDDTPV